MPSLPFFRDPSGHCWWGSQQPGTVSQHCLANALCPLFTLLRPLSPSLLAGDLMSEFAVKREAVRLALPPCPAPSPMAPSSLPLRGQRGSPSLGQRSPHIQLLPPLPMIPLQGASPPAEVSPGTFTSLLCLLPFKAHPEWSTLAVSALSTSLSLSHQALPGWLPAPLPHPLGTAQPSQVCPL